MKVVDVDKSDNKIQCGVSQTRHLQSIGGESLIVCDEAVQDNRHAQIDNSSQENAYFTQSLIETSNSQSEICA